MLNSTNHPINCGLATSVFTRTFQKRKIAEKKFEITSNIVNRVLSEESGTLINLDKNGTTTGTPLKSYLRSFGASTVSDYIFNINILGTGYFQKINIVSESTEILSSPNVAGIGSYQTNGLAKLTGTSDDGESYRIAVETSLSTGVTVDTFESWASGSLARHCTDQINSLIEGKTQLNVFNISGLPPIPIGPNSSDVGPQWNVQVTNFPTIPRNPNCWANGINLSCASPWNSRDGSHRAGTLISPRHVIFCNHSSYWPYPGDTITFVSSSGTFYTRTITNDTAISGIPPFGSPDIRISVLDSDVPNDILFAKVLPSGYQNYLPGLNTNFTIPVMCLNQTERASISALSSLGFTFSNIYAVNYPNHYRELIRFDSGNPCFLIINNEPVLLGVFTAGGGGSGGFVTTYINQINAAMSGLGGGPSPGQAYQLTTVDLSSFNTY